MNFLKKKKKRFGINIVPGAKNAKKIPVKMSLPVFPAPYSRQGPLSIASYLVESSSCLYLNISRDVGQTLGFRWFLRICQWTASTARSSDHDMSVLVVFFLLFYYRIY